MPLTLLANSASNVSKNIYEPLFISNDDQSKLSKSSNDIDFIFKINSVSISVNKSVDFWV